MKTDKLILDACCGSRMFWFNKHEPHTIYMDIREESLTLCDGRTIEVKADVIADCRDTPFPDNTFNLIIFDPPHLKWVGENSWMAHKYGKLPEDWKTFRYECVGWRGLYRNSYSLYRAAAPTLFQAKLWLALFKVKQFIKRK